MPSLSQLRDKWFLKFDGAQPGFPPVARHPGSTVSPYSDGNLVTPIIDGAAYMRVWHDSLRALIGQPGSELYHAAWGLEDVKTLGPDQKESSAIAALSEVGAAGVPVFIPISKHGFGFPRNRASAVRLWRRGMTNVRMDNRFPVYGSNHQKYTCVKDPVCPRALVGSADLTHVRWDTPRHPPDGRLTHEVGVLVEGAAVADIERAFIDRWNDPSRARGLLPPIGSEALIPAPALISSPPSAPRCMGTHSVQVLETYGITRPSLGYSWSPVGEFTVWASYLNAFQKAEHYIYIEEQYFFAWDWPPRHGGPPGPARDSDVIFQLGEAIRRGVTVIVVIPGEIEYVYLDSMRFQRDVAIHYLAGVAASAPGELVMAYLSNAGKDIYIHSKVAIVDDELVLVGSANINQRGLTHDGELHLGIVDADNAFARELRRLLWEEHLEAEVPDDPDAAIALFIDSVARGRGRVRPSSIAHPGEPPRAHRLAMRRFIDPYAGPPR